MLSVWRCKFESVKKCESGWSKVQYVCDTIMLTSEDKVCYYSITHSSASSHGSHVSLALQRLPALPPQVWLTGLQQDSSPTSTSPSSPPQSTLLLLGGVQ